MARFTAKCCNFNRTYIEVVALGRGTCRIYLINFLDFVYYTTDLLRIAFSLLVNLYFYPELVISVVKMNTIINIRTVKETKLIN